MGDSKIQVGSENVSLKQVLHKPPPPIVPVAQFEAFKVYEDSKENDVSVNQSHKSVDNNGTAESDLSLVKKEWFAQEAKAKVERDVNRKLQQQECKTKLPVAGSKKALESEGKVIARTPDRETPMSIEKPIEDECMKLLIKSKSNKDLFFENEEYRSDIYLYLREHEVSISFILLC